MKKIDVDTWIRKEHFEFFNRFDEPFWGIQTTLDLTHAKAKAKEKDYSLFAYYLHKGLTAAMHIENFRYRLVEGDVYLYDDVGASATVAREDGLFGFTHMPYAPDFNAFRQGVVAEINRVQSTDGPLLQVDCPPNVMHVSTIPWVEFTGLSHARHFQWEDSAPKMTFGKLHQVGGRWKLPLSLHLNHALADGLHAGLFFEEYQRLLNA